MRQFDICQLRPIGKAGTAVELVVVLQADLVSGLKTRVVAPLTTEAILPAIARMRPAIEHDGTLYRLIADRLSVISVKSLDKTVGSCPDREWDIRRALDLVFVGV